MIIIQNINLFWIKKYRGAPFSTERNNMDNSFLLPQNFLDYSPFHYKYHNISIIQEDNGFRKTEKIINIEKTNNIRIHAVEIVPLNDKFELIFKYNSSVGKPARTFKDRNFKESFNPNNDSIDNLLIEKIADVSDGDYVRILLNGRFTDWDTGNWYYSKNILNILYLNSNNIELNILKERKPNIFYKQIAKLY